MAKELLAIVANPAEPAELRAQAAIALGPGLEQVDTEGDELALDFDSPKRPSGRST
jgi:hypothetical protein